MSKCYWSESWSAFMTSCHRGRRNDEMIRLLFFNGRNAKIPSWLTDTNTRAKCRLICLKCRWSVLKSSPSQAPYFSKKILAYCSLLCHGIHRTQQEVCSWGLALHKAIRHSSNITEILHQTELLRGCICYMEVTHMFGLYMMFI